MWSRRVNASQTTLLVAAGWLQATSLIHGQAICLQDDTTGIWQSGLAASAVSNAVSHVHVYVFVFVATTAAVHCIQAPRASSQHQLAADADCSHAHRDLLYGCSTVLLITVLDCTADEKWK